MISDILKELAEKVDRFHGIVLTGMDGFAVDKLLTQESDFEQLVVELVSALRRIASATNTLELGKTQELLVISEKFNILFSNVFDTYYLALGVGQGASIGKARYQLKRAAIPLRKELAPKS